MDGMKDALNTRNITHDWSSWSDDWSWMSLYFSIAVWSAILLINCPRIKETKNTRDTNKPLLFSGVTVYSLH